MVTASASIQPPSDLTISECGRPRNPGPRQLLPEANLSRRESVRTFPHPTFIESLYNYGLFFTFTVAGLLSLGFSMIGGRAPETSEEPETA